MFCIATISYGSGWCPSVFLPLSFPTKFVFWAAWENEIPVALISICFAHTQVSYLPPHQWHMAWHVIFDAMPSRAWQGYFHNTTDRGGGGYFYPRPQNSGPTGWICKIQTAFDRSGECVDGSLILLTSGSLMTSQVRPKSKCLTILRVSLCRTLEPYGMEINQYNDMDRVWDTSKYHPKLSVSILVKIIQGHEVKERSNWKVWVWEARYMLLGQFIVKTRKIDLGHFLNGPNGTNFATRKNAEFAGNSVKNCRFRPSKR